MNVMQSPPSVNSALLVKLYLGSNPLMLLEVIIGAIKSSSIMISVSSSPVYDDDDFVGD